MARYYFNLSDGTREADETGTEMANDQDAQREAVRFAGEVMRHEPARLEHGQMQVDVTDHEGALLFRIDVRLARLAD